tara:strand:- start:212 stop:598 length:387 start_codon:yes stop_codon:yes gene_type:complete
MRILGIGVDIVDNNRIRLLIKKKKFINRSFGKNEIKYSKKIIDKTGYFAKRFAAKEALAKSFGTGFRNNLNLKDIEILNDKIGKPYFIKTKKMTSIINRKFKIKNYNLFLSITDEENYSVAFTILQSN